MFFLRNFSGASRGPGGRRTSESALTHAQLRASGWTPRSAPQGSGLGAPRGLGRSWSLKWHPWFQRAWAKPFWKSLPNVNSAPQHTHTHIEIPSYTFSLSLESREVPAHVDYPKLAHVPFPCSHIHTVVQSQASIQNITFWDTRNVKHRCPRPRQPQQPPATGSQPLSPSYAMQLWHVLPLVSTKPGQHSHPVT